MLFRCVSETVPVLNDSGNSPIGVILIVAAFVIIGIYVTLLKNPP